MSRTESASQPAGVPAGRRRANGWPVLPMRIFLAALFMFAGYAKLAYPGFFNPKSFTGLKASVDAVKHGTPLGGALRPLSDHPSLFGHITAFAEIAIGLGLLVGLLTRIAALGGMILTIMIALSINWGGIKEYTGSSGWFTSVDLAVAAALSVFLIGGADPISLDALIGRYRAKRSARDDSEPGFRHNEFEDSRRRLQGDPEGYAAERYPATGSYSPEQDTQQLPVPPAPQPESNPESNSLWNTGRRAPDQPGSTDRDDAPGDR